MQVGSSSLFKENYATWNNLLVVGKGVGFRSYLISLGLGSLTYFLKSEKDKFLVKQKMF